MKAIDGYVWLYNFWCDVYGNLVGYKVKCKSSEIKNKITVYVDNSNPKKIKRSHLGKVSYGRHIFMEEPDDEFAKKQYIDYYNEQIEFHRDMIEKFIRKKNMIETYEFKEYGDEL